MWTCTVDRGSWIGLGCSSNSSSSRCLCLIFFGLWASSLPRPSVPFSYLFFVFWRTLDQLGKLVLRPLLLAFAGRRSKYLKPRLWSELHGWQLEGRRRLYANASAWMSNETDERPQCAVAAPAPTPAATLLECVCTNYALRSVVLGSAGPRRRSYLFALSGSCETFC